MKTLIYTFLVITLISCGTDGKEFVNTSWKVISLEADGKLVKATNDVILTVKENQDFILKLDTNRCFGSYDLGNGNTISLGNLGCTEMCCDSEFSQAVASAMYAVKTIDLKNDQAILSGKDTKITFERVPSDYLMKTSAKTDQRIIQKEKTPTEETTNIGKITREGESHLYNDEKKGDYISIYKSLCKGNCAEYTMTIYKDGTAAYHGKEFTQIPGKHMITLSKEKTNQLFAAFEAANYTDFSKTYDDPKIMDLQNTYLTYNGKMIHIRYKNEAPKALKNLLKMVEETVAETGYVVKK